MRVKQNVQNFFQLNISYPILKIIKKKFQSIKFDASKTKCTKFFSITYKLSNFKKKKVLY